jgi:hypothetical protein
MTFGGNHQGGRSITVAVAIKPELKDLLRAASEDHYRSVSEQTRKYITDGLVRDGYIKPSKTAVEV